ncbi:L-rhamnose mutarotase [Mucilaginibacter agri]|uniref:L-rhamnose mutarotase n=1 Tax=Mucilaginibacter agri TaxID=2695265 RepID=A0A966DVQ3_9SPHI|nr:L-rhamnose mutarotase [Mucilaginibacter agri]NCD71711.1 L-rhamnose mutarotase [Mucilaginibacter agri]
MKRYCLALDLIDDAALINQYEHWHAPGNIPPEIKASIKNSGIIGMQIYRTANRLFMIMDTDETFSFERKADMDAGNPYVQEWEKLMWQFQQPLPWAAAGDKWVLMDQIFQL